MDESGQSGKKTLRVEGRGCVFVRQVVCGYPPETKARVSYKGVHQIGGTPGCGPGAQTLRLAELSKGEIYAVDNHSSLLDQLRQTVADRGLSAVIHPMLADMTALRFEDQSFDVIWAEGSIFITGVENALRQWRPLLKEHGTIAFTEVSWLRTGAPEDLSQFWQDAYPGLRTIDETIQKIDELGFCSTGYFILPESDWWDDYYNPIMEKLPKLSEKYKSDVEALKVVEMQEKEIETFRRYSDFYGYVFYIAEKEAISAG